jgi:hypothetical protein
MSYNAWLYVYANPINTSDPSGHIPRRGKVGSDFSYSCNCGWIDWPHAGPGAARKILARVYYDSLDVPEGFSNEYKVIKVSMNWWAFGSVEELYVVRKWMSPDVERSIALAMFMDLSERVEDIQSDPIIEGLFHSGYSEEDLHSNLIGFYTVVLHPRYSVPETGEDTGEEMEGSAQKEYVKDICTVLNKEDSLIIFDEYGEFQKVRTWENPRLKSSCYIDGKCGLTRAWPSIFRSIRPMYPRINGEYWEYRGQVVDGGIRGTSKEGVYHLNTGIASAPPQPETTPQP